MTTFDAAIFRIQECLTRWVKTYPSALTFYQKQDYSIYVEPVITYCLNEIDEILSQKFMPLVVTTHTDDINNFPAMIQIGFSFCAYLMLTPVQWTTCSPYQMFASVLEILDQLSSRKCCSEGGAVRFAYFCQKTMSSVLFLLTLQSDPSDRPTKTRKSDFLGEQKMSNFNLTYHAVSASTMRQKYLLQQQKDLTGAWVAYRIQLKALGSRIKWLSQLPVSSMVDVHKLLSIWQSNQEK
jgi:hypothetical protein